MVKNIAFLKVFSNMQIRFLNKFQNDCNMRNLLKILYGYGALGPNLPEPLKSVHISDIVDLFACKFIQKEDTLLPYHSYTIFMCLFVMMLYLPVSNVLVM